MSRKLLEEWKIAYLAKGGNKTLLVDSEEVLQDFANWLEYPRSRTPHETDPEQGGAKVFSRPECLFVYCPYGERGLCTDEAGGCLHKNGNYKAVATDDDK